MRAVDLRIEVRRSPSFARDLFEPHDEYWGGRSPTQDEESTASELAEDDEAWAGSKGPPRSRSPTYL
jgi:hypothetical protein